MRHKEGVKIYFDPVSTAAREESARDLAARVLADPSKKDCINTVGTHTQACSLKIFKGAHCASHLLTLPTANPDLSSRQQPMRLKTRV